MLRFKYKSLCDLILISKHGLIVKLKVIVMKIIFSPSKTQSIIHLPCLKIRDVTPLRYPKITRKIASQLRQMTKEELSFSMRIQGKLLDETYTLIHTHQPTCHAIELFRGVAYEQLSLSTFTSAELDYLENHLRILCAYYGILTPLTEVLPYRLDFTIRNFDLSLTQLWKATIQKEFRSEDLIFDLASSEYSSLLDRHVENIHTILFLVQKGNAVLKPPSYEVKRMRGQLLSFMVETKVETIEELRTFDRYGYRFDASRSDTKNSVFVRWIKERK